ncbi:MAG TPA: hypothetical protein VMC07_01405 [Candidatus Omnitrophota bacterium]|nr:hypothetical protein [Candidatus Omnitrophota bacterium]
MADKNKKPTQKEIEAEMAKGRKSALMSIDPNSGYWNYALPKLVTSEQYGQLSQIAGAMYGKTISKAPSQDVYERLFLPELAKEGGAITSPYLQETARQILAYDFQRITVEDALKYVGSKSAKGILEGLKAIIGKMQGDKPIYVAQLGEEIAAHVTATCMTLTTNDKVKGLLDEANKGLAAGLEKILADTGSKKGSKK